MGLRVNNNIAAINAYRNLSITEGQMGKSLEKLSSGFRINRAGDDAAGLAISEKLRSQVNGLKVAQRNAQDGISVIQTAEGALTEVHALLQRVRDLAVQASNTGANDTTARESAAKEVESALAEIDRIASATKFGGTALLAGDKTDPTKAAQFAFQVGSEGTEVDRIDVAIKAMNVNGLEVNAGSRTWTGAALAASDLTTETQAAKLSLTAPDGSVVAKTVTLDGTTVKRIDGVTALDLDSADETVRASDLKIYTEALQKVVDTQFGENVLKAEVVATGTTLEGDGTSATAAADERGYTVKFSTVNVAVGTTLTVEDALTGTTQAGTAATAAETANSFGALSDGTSAGAKTAAVAVTENGLRAAVAAGESVALYRIDHAINMVSEQRGELGAYQNRLEHTIANLAVTTENLSASESRIRDTDMAQEMTAFTRAQILVQAGTAMLAQANSAPQAVLTLLRG